MLISMLAALLGSAASVQAAPTADASIVVTGQKIRDADAKLKACIARGCPPDEEIDAALALAETQLLSGDYRDARTTLLRSLSRNKDEARRYPIPVSDLYRANGKVAAHLGYDDDYYRSTWGIYRTLKQGLPSAEDRKFSALMEVAEMTYRTRGHERARLYYDSIARQARDAGRPDLAAIAELRSAIRHLPPGSPWQNAEIKRIANLDGADMRAPVLEAKLALARIAFENDDEPAAEAALRGLSSLNIKRPILVYTPPFIVAGGQSSPGELARPMNFQTMGSSAEAGSLPAAATRPGGTNAFGSKAFATQHTHINVEDEWMDVSFRVTPEGKVADLKVLRRRGNIGWAPPLLTSIAGRRYTPGRENDPASVRVERYTYTSGLEKGAKTRVAVHSPKPRVEFLDLSPMGITSTD